MRKEEENFLKKIKLLLKTIAPDSRVLLYGSRARGDAKPGSDWDILIILNQQKIKPSDYELISYPIYELGWQEDKLFSIKLYTKKQWMERSFTSFYKNVEKEGILL